MKVIKCLWKGKYISITELRQNATQCIQDLQKTKEKIIFINNKPQAVLIDFDQYEKIKNLLYTHIGTLHKDEITPEMLDQAHKIKNLGDNEFMNIH